mmetsp:Transcript_10287/g.34013  ORF Transcript_10287/g.34013 Transcript_10287/m.34013 type:complete len:381 (-) Transcript_10287:26-1168(-)
MAHMATCTCMVCTTHGRCRPCGLGLDARRPDVDVSIVGDLRVLSLTCCYRHTARVKSRSSCRTRSALVRNRCSRCVCPADGIDDELPCLDGLGKTDAAVYPQPIEHEDHILGRHVAGRPRACKGAAAEPGHRRVDGSHAVLQRYVDVGKRLSVRVVAVHRKMARWDFGQYAREQSAHAPCRACADGVREAHLVAAGGKQTPGHVCHRRGCNGPLKWTAESAADVAANPYAAAGRSAGNFLRSPHGLVRCTIVVALRERCRGDCHDGDGGSTCRPSAFKSLEVQHEDRVLYAGDLVDTIHHRVAVRHLRDRLGRDEGRGFHSSSTNLRQAVDKFDLGRRVNESRFILQTVAWAHLVNPAARGQGTQLPGVYTSNPTQRRGA